MLIEANRRKCNLAAAVYISTGTMKVFVADRSEKSLSAQTIARTSSWSCAAARVPLHAAFPLDCAWQHAPPALADRQ